MTEEEAKTKICPTLMAAMTLASVAARAEGASDDIVDGFMAKSVCLASNCMMWTEDKIILKGFDSEDVKIEGGTVIAGRCGLAK